MINIQPNRWSCVLTAFANAVDIDQNDIISLLGHDGSEIIFPDLPEPLCRRGFDPREIIYVLLKEVGTTIIQLDRFLERRNPNGETYSIDKTKDLYEIMKGERGILTGTIMGRFHAYAWDGQKFISSSDEVHTLENLNIHTFYMVV
jgi:hypothetical protein